MSTIAPTSATSTLKPPAENAEESKDTDGDKDSLIPASPLFSQFPVAGKQQGMVASVPIPASTTLITEAPLLSIPSDLVNGLVPHDDAIKTLDALFTALSPHTQAQINSLYHSPAVYEDHKLLGIIKTNAVEQGTAQTVLLNGFSTFNH